LQACEEIAWEIVNDSYRTDLCLLHPPYHIAIAALYIACVLKGHNHQV
jgi:cyclin C